MSKYFNDKPNTKPKESTLVPLYDYFKGDLNVDFIDCIYWLLSSEKYIKERDNIINKKEK